MSSAPANMQQQSLSEVMNFRKSWRVYQSRLLDRLDRFLANKRLHLVAAPGSGKTVLGLEVIRRISQPTLVLAPTITIRDQWVDRLVELFLAPGSGRPEWVSTDMRNPTFLTVAPYTRKSPFQNSYRKETVVRIKITSTSVLRTSKN